MRFSEAREFLYEMRLERSSGSNHPTWSITFRHSPAVSLQRISIFASQDERKKDGEKMKDRMKSFMGGESNNMAFRHAHNENEKGKQEW